MDLFDENRVESISHFFLKEEWDKMALHQRFMSHQNLKYYDNFLKSGKLLYIYTFEIKPKIIHI